MTSVIERIETRQTVHGGGDGPVYEARIAQDEATRAEAYGVRYRSYLAYGHIAPNPSCIFRDRFDELPNATTVVVYRDKEVVGSVRVCLLRRGPGTTSPGREAFPEEVEAMLRQSGPEREGHEGMEANRLVRSPEAANDQSLVFMLLRLAGRLAIANQSRMMISCVRQNHIRFYRRIRFHDQAGPRSYPGLTCPMWLLACTREDYDIARASHAPIDPDASHLGELDGFEAGKTVYPRFAPRN